MVTGDNSVIFLIEGHSNVLVCYKKSGHSNCFRYWTQIDNDKADKAIVVIPTTQFDLLHQNVNTTNVGLETKCKLSDRAVDSNKIYVLIY